MKKPGDRVIFASYIGCRTMALKVVPTSTIEEFTLGAAGAPWSCMTLNVFIVSSCDSDEKYEGAWTKNLRLKVELKTVLPVDNVPAGMPDASIEFIPLESKPLLCIDHPVFNGLWNVSGFTPNRKVLYCLIPKYDGEEYKANNYYVIMPTAADQNICATRIPPPNSSCGINREASSVSLAPPLCFQSRMTVVSIDEISTCNQTFRTSNLIEMKLEQFIEDQDEELLDTILAIYGFSLNRIMISDVVEHISEQEKSRVFIYNDEKFDVCFRTTSHVLLPELFELESFPFDQQDLTIKLSLHLPYPRGKLMMDTAAPSIFKEESFRFKSEFDITYKRQVHSKETCSNPQVNGSIHTSIAFSLNLTRKPQYCVTNVVVPIAVLAALASLSIGVKTNDGSRMDTGDRLSVTLTLLLTAVAFKLTMASNLPQLPYQTTLDVYILICNFWILMAACENVLFPLYGYSDRGDDEHKAEEKVNESYFSLLYLGSFLLINILFWRSVYVKVQAREKVNQTKYDNEEAERIKHTAPPPPSHVMSGLLISTTDTPSLQTDPNAPVKKKYTKVAHGFGNRTAKARARRRSTLQGAQQGRAPGPGPLPMPTITGASPTRGGSIRLAPISSPSTPI